jgi:hypothetical protein
MNIEETMTTTNAGSVDGDFKPAGTFMDIPYFDCDDNTFHLCAKGKRKGAHWNTFMGKSVLTDEIKAWLKNKKNQSFMLRNKKDSTMIYAHKGVL